MMDECDKDAEVGFRQAKAAAGPSKELWFLLLLQ